VMHLIMAFRRRTRPYKHRKFREDSNRVVAVTDKGNSTWQKAQSVAKDFA
jgi:hypothetical protein